MNDQTCPISATLRVIGGKWKILILWQLQASEMRFGVLRKAIPTITQKMLTQQLRELERDGVVFRRVYAEVPPRVEYSLTTLGHSLQPVLDVLCQWGRQYQNHQPPEGIDIAAEAKDTQ